MELEQSVMRNVGRQLERLRSPKAKARIVTFLIEQAEDEANEAAAEEI